jgi:hypothetical protein
MKAGLMVEIGNLIGTVKITEAENSRKVVVRRKRN